MTERKAQKKQQLRIERLQLAQVCRHPMLLEAYLRRIEDALRVKASESVLGMVKLDEVVVYGESPAFNTGLSIPPLSKIPRSQLLTAIRQASVNAAILFPKGLSGSLHGIPEIDESTKPSRETLARIALSPLSLWIHAAVANALLGGRPDVFFELVAKTFRTLLKEDEPFTSLSYVTAIHKATVNLVKEAYESYEKCGTPKPWKVLGVPTFMPSKYQVKKRAVDLFGKGVPDIGRRKNPKTGKYESRDSAWTRILASAGLRTLIENRGRPGAKNSKSGIKTPKRGFQARARSD
jgi:hypothetical protein